MSDLMGAAEAIFRARTHRQPVAPVRDLYSLSSVEEAYAVQRSNTERWLDEGRISTGHKIGLTSKAVQTQLGVAEPDFGVLWGDMAFGPGDCLSMTRFMQPKAEVEIAFVLEKDLSGESLSITDIISAVAYLLPAVEVVDSAIARWDIKLVDTIADNASSGGYVLGDSPRLLNQVDLRGCGMLLSEGENLVSHGVGAACLGSPLNAVLWLARKMVALGDPLKAGALVMSGALGPMVEAKCDRSYRVDVQGFSPFSFSFEQ